VNAADSPDFDAEVAAFWNLLMRMVLDGEKRLSAVLEQHELTPPQFYVLKTLTEQGGRCNIGLMARLHGLTNPTMTGLVKRLEASGLVKRQHDLGDRRAVSVMLTPEGQARYDAVRDHLLAQLRDALRLIPPEERARLRAYLTAYASLIML
jgi:DNA-binding MarR family transcriptional regulator